MAATNATFSVKSSRSLTKLENRERANEMLGILVRVTQPLLTRRRWNVGMLVEFYPKNGQLLGLNMNRGSKIMIRLRRHNSVNSFLDMESVLGTFLHELVHNEIGEHSFEFYDMLDKIDAEVQQDMNKNGFSLYSLPLTITAPDTPVAAFGGKGQRLGGTMRKPTNMQRRQRELILQAAERRRQQALAASEVVERTTDKKAFRPSGCGSQEEFSAQDWENTLSLTQEIELPQADSPYCSPCVPSGSMLADVGIIRRNNTAGDSVTSKASASSSSSSSSSTRSPTRSSTALRLPTALPTSSTSSFEAGDGFAWFDDMLTQPLPPLVDLRPQPNAVDLTVDSPPSRPVFKRRKAQLRPVDVSALNTIVDLT